MNLFKFINSSQVKSFCILFSILLFHLFCINFYPVNDEFIFPVGAKLIESLNINVINNFFDYNANTLGFSITIFFLSKIFPFDYYTIGKLLSSSGLILIYVGTFNLLKIINFNSIKNKHILILLILLNPLIFTFSFRSTPDFFSTALAFFSVTCFIINKNFFLKLFLLIIFSFAVIIKPHCAIIILLIFADLDQKFYYSKKNIVLFLWFLLSLTIPLLYFILNFNLFNFFIIPEQLKSRMIFKFEIKFFIIKILSYIGFLNLFIITLYLDYFITSLKKNPLRLGFYFLISTLISFFFMQDVGELNFGFINNYLNSYFFYFLLSLSFFIFCDYFLYLIKKKGINKYILCSFCLTIIFLIFLCYLQPAQRYLLPIIPILLVSFFLINKIMFLNILTIIIYLTMNIPLFLNHYYTSKNIENVLVYLQQNNIIKDTHPGAVRHHALNYFIDFEKDTKNFMNENILFSEKKKYFITDKEPLNKDDIIFISKSNNIFKKNKNLYLLKK